MLGLPLEPQATPAATPLPWRELSVREAKFGLKAFSVHPGTVATAMASRIPPAHLQQICHVLYPQATPGVHWASLNVAVVAGSSKPSQRRWHVK